MIYTSNAFLRSRKITPFNHPYPYLAAIDLLCEGEMFEWSVSSENLLVVL
jgi:hypothetical protein